MLIRSGGYQDLTLTQLLTLNASSISSNLAQKGMGLGLDTGIQTVYNVNKRVTLLGGLAATDMGDTSFSAATDSIKSNYTAGVAARFMSQDIVTTVSFDYAHLFDDMDWREKTHLGLELKLPIISFYAGLSQLYPTYGVGIDLWLLKVLYTSYAEDQTGLHGINPERRNYLHVALKFEL